MFAAMLTRLRTWLAARRTMQLAKQHAVAQALAEFRRTRDMPPMGAHVLRLDAGETIVRVMFLTNHIPPDRAWFAVSQTGVRELSFDDVAPLESPWR